MAHETPQAPETRKTNDDRNHAMILDNTETLASYNRTHLNHEDAQLK
jgi:hypothetical protein